MIEENEIVGSERLKIFRITTIPLSLAVLLRGQLRFMGDNSFEVIACSSKGSQIGYIKKNEKCEHVLVPFTRAFSPITDLICLYKLIKVIRRYSPSIVHSHTPKAGLIGMLAAKLAGVSIRLHTVAGLPLMETKGFKRKLLVWAEKLTYACAIRIYPNSFGLKGYLEQNIYRGEKLKVLGNGSSNGIDVNFFKPSQPITSEAKKIRRKLDIPMTAKVMVFIGRIVTDKGVNELVAAFKKIQEKYEDVHLLLVGPYEEMLDPLNKNTWAEIKRNSHIYETGFQEDVRPYLAAADFLVFPSYREGFPNVPMQAGAMGLPAIVTAINGCDEIIEEGVNGVTIPPKDTGAIVNAIDRLLQEPELLKQMSANARECIVSRFDQKMFWKTLLEEYKSLLQEYV